MSGEGLAQELRATIAARRTFGRHPLWLRILDGRLPRAGLRTFAVQFFLQVREFPRAVSALHASCPFPDERVKLAESLYEEETGRLSGCDVSHPELFIRFGQAVGAGRNEMVEGTPLAGTAALIDWFAVSSRERSFVEGTAAITLAAEGQVPGAFGPFARALEARYGLTRAQVAFWDVHEAADREHSDVGDHIVVRAADSAELQAKVRHAVDRSLDAWWRFLDDVERAIDTLV